MSHFRGIDKLAQGDLSLIRRRFGIYDFVIYDFNLRTLKRLRRGRARLPNWAACAFLGALAWMRQKTLRKSSSLDSVVSSLVTDCYINYWTIVWVFQVPVMIASNYDELPSRRISFFPRSPSPNFLFITFNQGTLSN